MSLRDSPKIVTIYGQTSFRVLMVDMYIDKDKQFITCERMDDAK